MTTYAYWWNKVPNYGDQLSPLLLRHFGELDVRWAEPQNADIVGCGSLVDALPDGWTGTVAGSGVLRASTKRDLTKAKVLGLRGPLSQLHTTDLMDPMCIGDPGLLVCDLVEMNPKRGKLLGIMSHWSDGPEQLIRTAGYVLEGMEANHAVCLISARDADPMSVLTRLAKCTSIITSSLHGIITADALRIPRMAMPFASMTSIAEGGEFKWKDYGASIGQPVHFGEWQSPDPLRIMAMQENLVRMFRHLKELHR